MKINKSHYFFLFLLLVFLAACSTKKDKWANRNFQALNTKYNVLFHGNNALTDGVTDLKSQFNDNFWFILPVERMQVLQAKELPEGAVNKNFERGELKATKAIQKRSMLIGGKEKNTQIDEAYLLLGKSRYYDQRFIPAMEAFHYILYKNPESDKIAEAKIWLEKTNMRLGNDAMAVANLRRLLTEIKFKDQIFADANAALAQAYINMDDLDRAMACLKTANLFTKLNEEKSRYNYILGQLFEELGQKDSAFVYYQKVINMKRKASRVYIIHAHGQQSKQFDFKTGDTLVYNEKYRLLLKDRENRPFLDVINHQLALHYDQKKSYGAAIKYYNLSLRKKSPDKYLNASNYRNLAKINFDKAKYVLAGKYYDSTLVNLEPRTKEYNRIKRKRENLEDVIKYEGIVQKNDSILSVLALSDADKAKYYQSYISKVKKADQVKADLKKVADDKAKAAMTDNSGNDDASSGSGAPSGMAAPPSPTTPGQENTFYFYTQSTVDYGKLEFQRKWGDRPHQENWRLQALMEQSSNATADKNVNKDSIAAAEDAKSNEKNKADKPEYSTDFYIKKLPTSKDYIADLEKDRNFAYYQLGLIYKEKFTEYQLAADKLEKLLTYHPEERLVLPSMYHLYKIYEIINKEKALAMKNRIIAEYPDSRYASILSNKSSGGASLKDSPEEAYNSLFKLYEEGDYFKVLEEATIAIDQFTGEEIVPKYEFLKANTIGKLKGVAEYKTALNFVALNYPNSPEGKEAEAVVSKNIPVLEALQFSNKGSKNWNILYEITEVNSPKTKVLEEKVKKFASGRTTDKLKYTLDIYTMTEHLLVIHGIPTEESARGMVTILTDYKDYKISEPAIIISSENYKVVQVKKNLEAYLDFAKSAPPVSGTSVAPVQTNPVPTNTPNKALPGAPVIPGAAVPAPNQTQPGAPSKMPPPVTAPQSTTLVTPAPVKTQAKPVPATPVVPAVMPAPSQQNIAVPNKATQPTTAPQTVTPNTPPTPAPENKKP